MHGQLGEEHPRRVDLESPRQGTVSRLQRRQSSERPGQSLRARSSEAIGLSARGPAEQELGRIHEAVQGTDIDKKAAFNQAFKSLDTRIKLFLSLPIASLDQLRITEEMAAIGKTPLEESSP